MIKRIKDKLGVTLFEMTVSILVGSIVLVTLMSVLTMTVRAKMQFDYENRMINESYLISEQLKFAVANSLQKEFTIIQDDADAFILQIDYCDVIAGVMECSKTDPLDTFEPHTLTYDKINHSLLFDGEGLHSSNIHLIEGTEFIFTWNGEATTVGPTYFTGELTMVMNIQIETTSGGFLDPKSYTTMIMFSNYT